MRRASFSFARGQLLNRYQHVDGTSGASVGRRLLSRHAATLLVRNTVVSLGTFAFDIALLWLLVEVFAMAKVPAAAAGFVVANSVHYAIGRGWVFRGTERHVATGFIYFQLNSVVGLLITVGLFAAMIRWTPINYLAARVLVSVVAGLAVFVLNAVFNFRRI